MSWSEIKPSGGLDTGPSARSAHAATSYLDRFLLIFGGGSVAHCYNDLHVFDVEMGTWETVAVEGPVPSPRAGECRVHGVGMSRGGKVGGGEGEGGG